MIIDLNASVGHYPFRQLPHRTAAEVVALLDRSGIARAVAGSLHCLFYRDVHQGNAELHRDVQRHPGRLIPVATVNPAYVGWERDLREAVHDWGMKAVQLAPEYHGYTLDDAHGRAALARIEELGVPLLLRQRYEDRRQRHAWDRAEDLAWPAVAAAARDFPRLRFLLVNWAGLDGRRMVDAGLKGRCLVDLARLHVVYRKDAPQLIDTLGIESLAFGSHLPFDYVAAALVKLANLEARGTAVHEAVAWRNAARFLGLPG